MLVALSLLIMFIQDVVLGKLQKMNNLQNETFQQNTNSQQG